MTINCINKFSILFEVIHVTKFIPNGTVKTVTQIQLSNYQTEIAMVPRQTVH